MSAFVDWMEGRPGGVAAWDEPRWSEWASSQMARVGREPRPYRSVVAGGLFLRADALGYATQRDRWHAEWERLGAVADEGMLSREAASLMTLERISRIGDARRDGWDEADEWWQEHEAGLGPPPPDHMPATEARIALLEEIAHPSEHVRHELATLRARVARADRGRP